MQDREIVALYMDRKEDAIRQTQKKYHKYLLTVARNILANREDEEECVSDTYLAAWESIPPNTPMDLRTYLSKITRQKAIDIYRKRTNKKRGQSQYALSLEELSECFTDGKTPEQTIAARELGKTISGFLQTLPPEERNAFICRYFYFDSLKDVAKHCGMGESKLKSLLYRTRRSLREYLKKEGFVL